ncbi:uncharacterized protein CcaverHIS019_0207500 [Cutaneotrichosporon cavernicola]|uniref:alpha-1,2-Mannosidase n=1 Tax=Cutaneotrichosporon cavernicola TaxID=279322 RepID=A0AA48IIJ8_9TREE|nr:uncharacterized protein CcaverHIS019_0207500 [Cutaneotrichosporon cavernicola]BEI89388.1 hypothetical protein CcaverHIS019_0207500 [Cutaneotrichosporon cavernicola]
MSYVSYDKEKLEAMGLGPSSPTNVSIRFDAEGGSLSASAGAARSLRRVLTRRVRLVLLGMGALALVFYMMTPGDNEPPPALSKGKGKGPSRTKGTRPRPAGGAPAPNKLKRPGGDRPAPPPPPNLEVDMVHDADHPEYFVLDENGDQFMPNVKQVYAPLHPNDGDYRAPERLFSEVDEDILVAPKTEPFPQSRMREIVSDAPAEDEKEGHKLPKDAFSVTWKGPKDWNKPGPGTSKIQWPGFANGTEWETKEQMEVREARREAVKRGFMFAWQKYKDHAWGHDEVKPVSMDVSDPFNGWGASIVDTLDTLLIMGFQEEYNLARPFVNQLNFHWVKGRDWSQGYISPESEKDANGENWMITRDKTAGMQVFETGIRYLGGLLGAFDLSGDKIMLERAVDLANVLKKAFNTASGLPQGSRMDPGQKGALQLFSVSIAEVGSMSLELIRLGHATKEREWFDLAQRVTDFIEENVAPRSKYPPLIPMRFSPDSAAAVDGTFSFGAMTDSYYEYLIKAYKLLGGGSLGEQYKRLYTKSIDAASKLLFTDITVMPERDLFTIGKWENNQLKHEVEHLTCFAGGMLGMGAVLLDREDDLVAGMKFTNTCFWISQHLSMGIQPEVVLFFNPNDPDLYVNITTGGRRYHPPQHETIDDDNANHAKMFKDQGGTWRWRDDDSAIAEDSGRGVGLPIRYYKHLNGSPPGMKKTTPYYINRPETIESVFYMFRLTGDRKWQEKGWKMFAAWMEAATVDGGISSIKDVTKPQGQAEHGDNMESFMFAETFKYHYLLQSEPDLISLDDYVLNTEAHTLIANQALRPGASGLWKEVTQDLGVQGEGTDVQKWMRLKALEPHRRVAGQPKRGAAGGNEAPRRGGSGMGGGGGDPQFKPQPPGAAFAKVKNQDKDKKAPATPADGDKQNPVKAD